MTKTNSLLVTLRASYPHLVFAVVDKANTAYVDDDRYADQLIGVDTGHFLIIDPFESTCGRFAVDPDANYGLPETAANEILKHNCIPAETSSRLNP